MAEFTTLLIFALASSITPGPNNMLAMHSVASRGYSKSLPLILGIIFGYSVKLLIVSTALSGVTIPYMNYIAIGFMGFIAWKIAMSDPPGEGDGIVVGFWGATALQWINPKGWAVALAAVTIFRPLYENSWEFSLALVTAFLIAAIVCLSMWTAIGSLLSNFLSKRYRIFSVSAAAVMMGSVLYG